MAQFFCFDTATWNKVIADNMLDADRVNGFSSVLVSDTEFSMEIIVLEEFARLAELNIIQKPLEQKNGYAVIFGDERTMITGLIFVKNDYDTSHHEFMEFMKDGHVILIYLGDPYLIVVESSQVNKPRGGTNE